MAFNDSKREAFYIAIQIIPREDILLLVEK